ncbi:MAG: hypothetical protein M3R35_06290 [Candidatus Eremiobacteraeota bacterium]|nr:hypothetical protein [Candidatus Eremiobacteraeota bacterium]
MLRLSFEVDRPIEVSLPLTAVGAGVSLGVLAYVALQHVRQPRSPRLGPAVTPQLHAAPPTLAPLAIQAVLEPPSSVRRTEPLAVFVDMREQKPRRFSVLSIVVALLIFAALVFALGRGSSTFSVSPNAARHRATSAVHAVKAPPVPRSAAAPPAISLIRSFEVQDGVVQSGAPIVARYLTGARQGRLQLLDAAQIPIVSLPYRSGGLSTFKAPIVSRTTPYRLELAVRQGRAVQSASVGILVEPAVSSVARPIAETGPLMHVSTARIVGNSTLTVQLLRHPPQLQLTFQGPDGVTLARRSVVAGDASVQFAVPPITADGDFTVVASFDQGAGSQVVMMPLRVHVR